eukprot:8426-Prymnesium_polylepis.1
MLAASARTVRLLRAVPSMWISSIDSANVVELAGICARSSALIWYSNDLALPLVPCSRTTRGRRAWPPPSSHVGESRPSRLAR